MTFGLLSDAGLRWIGLEILSSTWLYSKIWIGPKLDSLAMISHSRPFHC